MAEEAPGPIKGKEGKEADGAPQGRKKDKYRKDKPWDDGSVDRWKPITISKEDAPKGGLLKEESSFATLFPQYREQYLKQVWPDVKAILDEHELKGDLNLVEGSMTVRTTRKTWDPFIIVKARDMLKLLSRSVPLPQAKKVLEDEMHCEILRISGMVRSKERFVKRRQRLVGPNGSTLKAIELLTQCHVLVQGRTVSIMGSIKGIKQCRRIIEDCFKNIHPIYHIKELMIRRELEKDPELKETNWERFLPQFKKRNIQRKKVKDKLKKKKSKEVFPPQPTPRKEDILMETGEYFLNEQERQLKKQAEKRVAQAAKSAERKRERDKLFEPPAAAAKPKKNKASSSEKAESAQEMAERLKKKAVSDRPKAKKTAADLLL